MNTAILIGRITKDLELKRTTSNLEYCNFTLAINRPVAKGQKPQADFINCVAWRQQAVNLTRFCGKGSQIAVEGSIQTGSYKNQQGQTVYTTTVVAHKITFLSTKQENQHQEKPSAASPFDFQEEQQQVEIAYEVGNEDLPF